MRLHKSTLLIGAFALCLVFAPFVLSTFSITLLNYIGLASLVALGLVLLTGVGGLTSFGQAAFVGLGAYTTAVLTTSEAPVALAGLGASPWLALVAGLLLTIAVAGALGFITLRLSGHYLPLGTIAWGIGLFYLFSKLEFLGRNDGISGIPPLSIGNFRMLDPGTIYFAIWITARGAKAK